MEYETIYERLTIEDFLKKIFKGTQMQYCMSVSYIPTLNDIANKIRYRDLHSHRIEIIDGRVKIVDGIYSGNLAKVIKQENDILYVNLDNDTYDNLIMIHINDVAYTGDKAKIVYILE